MEIIDEFLGEEEDNEDGEEVELRKLGYGNLICNQRVLWATIIACLCCVVYGELEPILSLRILKYDVTDGQTGLIFGIQPLTYAMGTMLTPVLVPRWVEARVTMIISVVLVGLATGLINPFFEDSSLVSMCVGLALCGFFMGPLCIPNMPEMMVATREQYPDCDLEHANSLLSGMLMAGFGTG